MSSGNTRSGAGFCLNDVKTITVSVVGLSGTEDVKGAVGVGKSLLCNRFVRGDYDNFYPEHSSVLSQLDFCGSSVINNEHWLYWGEALINVPEANNRVQLRVIEQTEFVDDENFEPFGGYEDYAKRATKTKLESADKLMYICREQLGLETEFEQRSLAESRITVDAFIFVYDVSLVESRSYDNQSEYALRILLNISKAKCPVVIAATKADISDENGQRALQKLIARKELRSLNLQIIEVSSVTNVNVVTLFALVASLVEKWKMKPRVLSYVEAAKVQRKKECEISDLYVALLRQLTPVEFWPQSKPTWNKLLTRFGLSQHNEYKNFVYVFGTKKAKDRYKIYVEEAKNFWIRQRTHAQIIRLPEILQVFIGEEKLMSLTWVEAQRIIFDHSLFNNYFLPVGTLSSDLDPGSSQVFFAKRMLISVIEQYFKHTLFLAYNEKSSSPFSWFPTRSPRHCTAKSLPCPVSSTAPTQPANTLKSLTANTEDLIPLFVKMCIKYIEEEGGFTTEGIYRIPGNQAQVSELENGFLSDSVNAFRLIKPPVNTAASALKNFFTNLSEPLIPCTTYCDQMELLAKWPLANQRTFVYLAAHLNRVAEHSAVNSMDTKNLAKVTELIQSFIFASSLKVTEIN
uniref:Rho-GAP domain-containing protein n=1 Tax=Syphacia muris TaxID=451379 RepID=A0A0N5AQ56_9BILA